MNDTCLNNIPHIFTCDVISTYKGNMCMHACTHIVNIWIWFWGCQKYIIVRDSIYSYDEWLCNTHMLVIIKVAIDCCQWVCM